jgi:hypothetical protein
MIYDNILQIEYINNYEFKSNIIDKYSHIIIDIFNKNINKYLNSDDDEIQIILSLFYFSIKEYKLGEDILVNLHNKNNYHATCCLGVYYKNILNDNDKSIFYLKIAANNNDIIAIMNLAYYYLTIRDFDNFDKYNKIGLEQDNEIYYYNMALFEWFNDKNEAMIYFNKLFELKNYRGYYLYSTLIINIKEKIKYIMLAIQIKPKKIYIDYLKEYTNNFERYILYNKYNIDDKLVSMIENINIIDNLYCPICLDKKNYKLVKLKCNHSICFNCINLISKSNKCCLCY